MQQGVVAEAYELERVVSNIDSLIEKARAAGVPVIWIQHSDAELPEGSQEWQYIPELERVDGEALVHKSYNDSFEDTDLEAVLSEHGVGHLIVTGAQTDACVRSTLHGALVRGYDTTLVADAHTTQDLRQWGSPISAEQAIGHTNMYWERASAPGRFGGTKVTAAVDFAVH
jgi:nicotinamidase-related amidase